MYPYLSIIFSVHSLNNCAIFPHVYVQIRREFHVTSFTPLFSFIRDHQGEYRVGLPDGTTQVVSYVAGGSSGYVADVRYEGGAPGYQLSSPPAPARGAADHVVYLADGANAAKQNYKRSQHRWMGGSSR